MGQPLLAMKQIPLTKGRFALVDDEDFDIVNQWKWSCWVDPVSGVAYALRQVSKGKQITLHRFLLQAPKGLLVDHFNGDGLDNRRQNIRLCTRKQNNVNSPVTKRNLVGLKGVSRSGAKWRARIDIQNKTLSLGSFLYKENAELAYKLISLLYYGEYAYSARELFSKHGYSTSS